MEGSERRTKLRLTGMRIIITPMEFTPAVFDLGQHGQ